MEKTALITGASKRIGKAIAMDLAASGWSILIHYNSSEEPARELEELLTKKYPEQKFSRIRADLTNSADVETVIRRSVEQSENLRLLVNNASVFNKGFIRESSSVLYDSQMDVNVKAPFLLMRDFAIHCRKGVIINFVDTRIISNRSDYAAYSLSKKCLWELTKMAALEFAPGIRVNAIAPGLTLPPEGKGEDYLRELAKKIPMQKPGSVRQVLMSVDYILNNDHLTGQLLFADGGENLGRNE